MEYVVNLLVSAGVLLLLAYLLPQIRIKSFWTALWVAFLVGLLNSTVGAILSFSLNLFTLFLLQFLVRLLVLAIIIKLVDVLVGNFEVRGFWPALVIAVALALTGTLIDRQFEEGDHEDDDSYGQVFLPGQSYAGLPEG